MRVRYTQPAALELNDSISYFLERAPSVAFAFADGIDRAVTRLLDTIPTPRKRRKDEASVAYTSADFATRSFIPFRETTS